MPQPHPRQSGFLNIPRRIWLRWLSLYFILFSLILLIALVVMIGGVNGALSALTGMALGIVALAALVNLGLGSLGLLLSFWKRRRPSVSPADLQGAPANWPRHPGLRFLYRASLGLVSAVLLYAGVWIISILTIVFLAENAMGWWYGWRMPQVKLGDSQQQVERLVGRGTFRTECSSAFAKDYSRATDLNRCANIVLYYQSNGGRWELGYDAENRVVSKQYVKP